MHTNSAKIYRITKRLRAPEKVEKYFPIFISFIGSTEQQQQKYQDMPIIKERGYVLFGTEEKRHTTIKTPRLFMVNNHGLIIHKLGYKKGRRDMIIIYISIYRKNTPL